MIWFDNLPLSRKAGIDIEGLPKRSHLVAIESSWLTTSWKRFKTPKTTKTREFCSKLAAPAILIIYMSYNPPKMEVHLLLAQCFLLPAKQYKEKSLVAATLHELHLPCFFMLHAPPTCTFMHQRHGLSCILKFFSKNLGNS